jgi:hypothetical protein
MQLPAWFEQFLLNRVRADLISPPRADVADLAVLIVIPSVAGNWIGERLVSCPTRHDVPLQSMFA